MREPEEKKPVPRKTPLADELREASVPADQNKNGTLDALRSVFRNNEDCAGALNLNTCNSYLDTYLRDLPIFGNNTAKYSTEPDPRTFVLTEDQLKLVLEQSDLRLLASATAMKLPLPIVEAQHKPPVLKFLNLAVNLSLKDRSIRESFNKDIQDAIKYKGPKRQPFNSVYAKYIRAVENK